MIPGIGGRGMNPKKMKQMMKQMGIDLEVLDDVKQVVIRLEDRDIVFNDAQVTIMDARGTKTYQITGTPEEIEHGIEIREDDVKLVAEQTGRTEEDSRRALEETGGDIAEAIMKLTEA